MATLRELRTPFLCTIAPKVCQCALPARELGNFKTLQKAIDNITGYHNVMVTFWGDQIVWLELTIVDIRDGQIVWRNGRLLKEDNTNGKLTEN